MSSDDVVAEARVVTIQYTLWNEAGEVLDTSRDRGPVDYLHGAGELVPGLERALEGQAVGAKLRVTVSPEDGYGLRDPEGKREFPREEFPEDASFEPGEQIVVEDEEGEELDLWVLAADAHKVVLDLNHPLAGETLHFEVEVVGLRPASAEELEHGHAHGDDEGACEDDEDQDEEG